MALRRVPSSYATIQDAVNAASAGDTIEISSSYGGNEYVTVTVNNLIFNAPGNVTGIVLYADGLISAITLAGAAPIKIFGTSADETFIGNAGNNDIDGQWGSDNIQGGDGADTISAIDDGFDSLSGGAGADTFVIMGGSGGGGTVDGGADIDTVKGAILGGYSYSNVEVLDSSLVYATAAQLSTFTSLIDSGKLTTQFLVYMCGAGGAIDFTSLVTGGDSVSVHGDDYLTAGVTVTGTSNADYFSDTPFDDVLNGGAGADTFNDNYDGDADAFNGGAGA
ncbi:hypothetical protein GJ654_14805, partial [Rhodoblastus acidophilus]|nr:hypothetical protein [Rhodoblastus acidophilus]